jgi:ferrous iron transport protein B
MAVGGVRLGDMLVKATLITKEQLLVFTVFISFFIPCLSTFAMLWKEMGKKIAFLSAALSVSVAVLLAWIIRILF